MKSEYSYELIRERISNGNFSVDEYLPDIDSLRNKLVFCNYDCAIIDEKFPSAADAIELFAEKNIQYIPFQGDFDSTIQTLNSIFSDDAQGSDITPENKPDDDRLIKYVEKEKIIEKPIRVEVPVYKSVYSGIRNKFIAVLSLSHGAGSTFFTLNFAKMLTYFDVLAAVIEPPLGKPTIFDMIGLEQRLDREGDVDALNFYSFPHIIFDNEKINKNKKNIDEGIEWYVPDPRKPEIKEWDYANMMKLIYASKNATVNIVDCGHHFDLDCVKNILFDMDFVIVIIDPNPVFVMQNIDMYDSIVRLKKEGLNVVFAINKWNKGINTKQLFDYLKVKPIMQIPFIDSKLVYKAFYDCEIPCTNINVKQQLEPEFAKLLKIILPNEIIGNVSSDSDKKGFIRKILGRIDVFGTQKS